MDNLQRHEHFCSKNFRFDPKTQTSTTPATKFIIAQTCNPQVLILMNHDVIPPPSAAASLSPSQCWKLCGEKTPRVWQRKMKITTFPPVPSGHPTEDKQPRTFFFCVLLPAQMITVSTSGRKNYDWRGGFHVWCGLGSCYKSGGSGESRFSG